VINLISFAGLSS